MLPKKIRVHPTLDRSTLTKDDVTGCSECGSMKPVLLKARGEVIACSECGAVQGVWNRISKSFDEAFQTKSGYIGGIYDNMTPDRPVQTVFFKKDLIPQASVNEPDLGPEILQDKIFQQQCTNFGYAILQIGDRLVRVYCGRPQEAFGNANPPVYDNMPLGQDSRYEISTQDNFERGRNRTKAVMRLVMAKSKPLDEETQRTVKKIVKKSILSLIENQ